MLQYQLAIEVGVDRGADGGVVSYTRNGNNNEDVYEPDVEPIKTAGSRRSTKRELQRNPIIQHQTMTD